MYCSKIANRRINIIYSQVTKQITGFLNLKQNILICILVNVGVKLVHAKPPFTVVYIHFYNGYNQAEVL